VIQVYVDPDAIVYMNCHDGGAKWVMHPRIEWASDDLDAHFLAHREATETALYVSGLPCMGFYYYLNRNYNCVNGDNGAWLAAYFSDVPRMKQIKEMEGPCHLFYSRFALSGNDPVIQLA